jgi:THO complex subunit 5
LTKLKWPQIEHKNTPWASHHPLCSLHSWLLTGSFPEPSRHLSLMMNGAGSSADSDIERRSVTHWEETEGTREDGELLAVVPADDEPNGSAVLDSMDSEMSPVVRSHSRGLSLISKSATPTKLSISHSFGRNDDDVDLLMYSDSELEDQPCIHEETEEGSQGIDKSWEDYASREFTMVLSKAMKKGPKVMLEAKVNLAITVICKPSYIQLCKPFSVLSFSNSTSSITD